MAGGSSERIERERRGIDGAVRIRVRAVGGVANDGPGSFADDAHRLRAGVEAAGGREVRRPRAVRKERPAVGAARRAVAQIAIVSAGRIAAPGVPGVLFGVA